MVTSDNPRGEDPHAIIDQMLEGIPAASAEAIEDRAGRDLRRRASRHARAMSCCSPARGHETYQEIAGVRHPFNDREVARARARRMETGARMNGAE